MGRQHVHLSADLDTARAVGARKAPDPVIFPVAACEAAAAGVAFYLGNEGVWLAYGVPARETPGYPKAPDQLRLTDVGTRVSDGTRLLTRVVG